MKMFCYIHPPFSHPPPTPPEYICVETLYIISYVNHFYFDFVIHERVLVGDAMLTCHMYFNIFGTFVFSKMTGRNDTTYDETMRFLVYYSSQFEPAHEIMVLITYGRPAKAQASLRIRAVSPEPSLFAHMKYGSRRRVRPKIRHLAQLDGCARVFEEWVYGGRKVP